MTFNITLHTLGCYFLPSLPDLYHRHCGGVCDGNVEFFTELDLQSCLQLTSALLHIGELTQLRRLNLYSCHISAKLLDALGRYSILEHAKTVYTSICSTLKRKVHYSIHLSLFLNSSQACISGKSASIYIWFWFGFHFTYTAFPVPFPFHIKNSPSNVLHMLKYACSSILKQMSSTWTLEYRSLCVWGPHSRQGSQQMFSKPEVSITIHEEAIDLFIYSSVQCLSPIKSL